MNRKVDAEKIRLALELGVSRGVGVRANPDQPLTYVLSDKKFFHHANIASAKAEKEFLQASLGRKIRIYKVWNINRVSIETDMSLLRDILSHQSDWNDESHAIDRLLTGAGF